MAIIWLTWSACKLDLMKYSKTKLRMSYRKLKPDPVKILSREHTRSYWKAAVLQCLLDDSGYELIFIDDFSISQRNTHVKGWSFKDIKSHNTIEFETISMTFLVEFSSKRFYGIMTNQSSNDAFVFRYFLSKVCDARTKIFLDSNSKFWLIIGNASIHKTDIIKEYAKNINIHLITISAYSPSLIAAESVIQSIKMKIKKYQVKGR